MPIDFQEQTFWGFVFLVPAGVGVPDVGHNPPVLEGEVHILLWGCCVWGGFPGRAVSLTPTLLDVPLLSSLVEMLLL